MTYIEKLEALAATHKEGVTPSPEEFVIANQKLHESAYPLRCHVCGRRGEYKKEVTLSDGKTKVLGAFCDCGAYKGPVVATPEESYRANKKSPLVHKEPVEKPQSRQLTPDERFRFMSKAARLGADEHELRCDLAGLGEELETCTLATAKIVIRDIEARRSKHATEVYQ